MSCDLVETRMRIRPRESSLSRPFTASSFVPPSKGERTAPWLDRASYAVPARLAATLHDERNRTSTRDACDQLLPTTHRRRVPTFRSATRGSSLAGRFGCVARFHDAPHASGGSVPFVTAGVVFPWRRPSSHPLTLPSPRSACPLRFRERRPPFRFREEAPASARPRPPSRDVP